MEYARTNVIVSRASFVVASVRFSIHWNIYFPPIRPHVLVDFVVLPPGQPPVTDFWGWDAHEAQLRCPHDVSGDIGGCSARRALKPKFCQPTQTMVTAGILPFRENSYGRAGNRTWGLMISSQRLWSLDHEAGHFEIYVLGITRSRPTAESKVTIQHNHLNRKNIIQNEKIL